MWNRMKEKVEKVASPSKKRGNQSPKAAMSPFSSPQNQSTKEDGGKKTKNRVTWGIKGKKSGGDNADDANKSKTSKDEEAQNKTRTTAKIGNVDHVDLEAARIVTTSMVNASLAVKKQQQKKNVRAEAKAIAWKCIANAAIELRCN